MKIVYPLIIGLITSLSIYAFISIHDMKIDLKYQAETIKRIEAQVSLDHLAMDRIFIGKASKVTMTAYNATVGQCDSTPFETASGRYVKEGCVAVSKDLYLNGWKFGKTIYVPGRGLFGISDRMNDRHVASIDFFMWSESEASAFGRQTGMAILLN